MTQPIPDPPCVRPGIAAGRDRDDSSVIYLYDEQRITHRPARLTTRELSWAQSFDGQSALADLPQRTGTTPQDLADLISRMDDSLLLDSPRFAEYVLGLDRDPSCIGCYPADPIEMRDYLSDVFTGPDGPGLPDGPPSDGMLRAVLVPHMDYARGGVTYGWGFKELYEHTNARLFVIIATSHYSPARFSLTRKNYRTPLGVVETDQRFVDRLVGEYGDGLFDDPFAHLPEHSIELEVALLQYLYSDTPFRIVPLLVGSFRDAITAKSSPIRQPDIARMVAALQRVEAITDEPICYIVSGDLAHVGPKFQDPEPITPTRLANSLERDQSIIQAATHADADGYFRPIAEELDCRNICGLPPTWLTLAVARPSRGRLLHYDRFVDPAGFESVSFASMAFDR